MNTLQPEFKVKLQQITQLSMKVNDNDKLKIFSMIKDHVVEIKELYDSHDDHWAIETGDLIVLCFELLMMENKDIDDVFIRCLPRFDKKLNMLLEKEENI